MNEAYNAYRGGVSQLLGDSLVDLVMWRDEGGLVGVLVLDGDADLDTQTRRALSELETSILQETGVHVLTLAMPKGEAEKRKKRIALMGGVRQKAYRGRNDYQTRRMKVLIDRAEKNLTAAETLTDKGLYNIAVSSAYYSAYLAAKALLVMAGDEPPDARRCLDMFMDKFVRAGLVPRELSTSLIMLRDAHTEAEFRLRKFGKHEAQELLLESKKFLRAARTILEGM
ncbi:MAG: HEPN domain-containing protein [candidate division WOR-3 bacterium]